MTGEGDATVITSRDIPEQFPTVEPKEDGVEINWPEGVRSRHLYYWLREIRHTWVESQNSNNVAWNTKNVGSEIVVKCLFPIMKIEAKTRGIEYVQ